MHTNSGVLNYAFYLICQGGSGTNDNSTPFVVTGIGIEKGRAIAQRAHTNYLISSSNYASAREAFLSAATDLYGSSSTEYNTISDVFGAVGIGITYYAKNSFNAGTIKINGKEKSSGTSFFATANSSQTLEAIPQYSDPYNYVWNTSGTVPSISNWDKQPDNEIAAPIFGASNISYTFSATEVNNNTTYIANLKKVCNLTFDTNLEEIGVTEACSIKVNGATVVTPTSQYQVVESNTIQLEAIDKTVLYVHLIFSKWVDGPSILSTDNPLTYTADKTETIYASYVIEPDNIAPSAPQNLTITESSDEHPFLSWDANPEVDIRVYKVYRKRNSESWSLAWTTSNTTLEDTRVTTTYRHGDDIFYKVTAEDLFYNESAYSNTVEIEARIEKQIIDDEIVEEAPKVYALNSNYPNPFNPTTQISYQIPNDGFVNLTVYNSLGQEVAVLVNQQQSTGNYTVQFNAINLPSGVYIYKLQADVFSSVKKMILTK